MIELPTLAYVKEVLSYDPETGFFRWRKSMRKNQILAGSVAGHVSAKLGYVLINFNGNPVYAHRLAWLYKTGAWPKNTIDHINGVRSDNRFCNLREATRMQNNNAFRRKSKANTSGYTGVYYHKQRNKWCARIMVFGKTIPLGLHETPEKAARAVQNERAKHGFLQNQ